MMKIEHVDGKGRKYAAYADDAGQMIIIGPPEGMVDELELPEPFATTLHNILYDRGLLNSMDVSHSPAQLTGALAEAMLLDVQKLMQAYFKHTGG